MNDTELRHRLKQYHAPEAPSRLEQRLWAAMTHLPRTEPIYRGLWLFQIWSLPLTSFAVAASVFIAIVVGHLIGSGHSGLPMSDILSSVGGWL